MVPFGLMFNDDLYQMLSPPEDPEFDQRLNQA
jgi:hypothetical protein